MVLKLSGESGHFIGYVGVDFQPTSYNNTWSFTDIQHDHFKVNLDTPEFKPTAKYYIKIEPFFMAS
jgi:hypothetical protein